MEQWKTKGTKKKTLSIAGGYKLIGEMDRGQINFKGEHGFKQNTR